MLDELKRAATGKEDEGIEMIFNIPQSERHQENEGIIRERLKAHFERHHKLLLKDKRKVLTIGIAMTIIGFSAMGAATLLLSKSTEGELLNSLLVAFLEPAAWFLLWEGLEQILFNSKNINPELEFYKKMSDTRGHIEFRSY
jgi:hypothetical protein